MATAPDPLLAITKLYHFTNVRNLPMIKKLDGLWATGSAIRCRASALIDSGPREWSLVAISTFTADIHLGGLPRRFPRTPKARRSRIRIASSICCCSARSSDNILRISMANSHYAIQAYRAALAYAAHACIHKVGP